MENFLQVINDIQDVFSTVGTSPDAIKLPQIVVVGSQSTGKSSVLESIVRKDFLPRGTGIVTRRPLIIQIVQDKLATETIAHFLHDPNVDYTDFDKVSDEIIKNTDQVCGTNKNISHEPITLKIISPDLPTLTLVDLPGVTKNPVGDQPTDIEQQTFSLVKKYVENPNSIILAVSPGNVDIANSEAIKISREVDPEGRRTIAVITKADLMEHTSESMKLLEGKTLPIKLGIVGVINRSQTKLEKNIPIEECIEDEARYFKKYYHYISGEMGTPYLTQRLCQILMNHVKNCLPELIVRITEEKVVQQSILDSLGAKIEDGAGSLAIHILEFCQVFQKSMEGRSAITTTTQNKNCRISGGQRLFEVFKEAICEELDKIKLPEQIREDIIKEVISTTGPKPALFTPNIAFDNLASRQINMFTPIVKTSVKRCSESIVDIISSIGKEVFKRFPNLKRETHHISLILLLEKTQVVEKFLKDYLKLELNYINTNHQLFTKERSELEKANKNEEDEDLSFEEKNVNIIRALLELYIKIIKNQLMDVIPKCVICFMVKEFCDDLHRQLMKNLFNEDKINELMKEDMFIEEKRDKALKMMAALEKADAVTSLLD